MKKIIFFLLISISSLSAIAQNQTLGFQMGMNTTSVKDYDSEVNSEGQTQLIVGISYNRNLYRKFILGMDALYAQQSYLVKKYYFSTLYPTVTEASDVFKYHYLSFPIKIGYEFGRKFKVIPQIGIVPSVLLKAESSTPQFNLVDSVTQVTAKVKDITSGESGFVLGWMIALEMDYALSNKLLFTTSLADYKNLKISTRTTNSGSISFASFALTVGLKYSLGKP